MSDFIMHTSLRDQQYAGVTFELLVNNFSSSCWCPFSILNHLRTIECHLSTFGQLLSLDVSSVRQVD